MRRTKYWLRSHKVKERRCACPESYGRPFVSKLWHDIRAVFSHVYLQSFLLHDIRAFFCHVYLRFIPKYMTIFLQTRIYMRTKKPIYMCYKQACGICVRRKSSYKRHRIIAGLPRARSARGTEPHTHRLWSTSFRLVVTWLTERTYVGTFTGEKRLIGRRATTWHCQIQIGGNTCIVCLFQCKED